MVSIDWRVRRLGQAVFTIWAVATITFGLIWIMPGSTLGSVVQEIALRGGMPPAQARELLETRLVIDKSGPFLPAYIDYLAGMLQGNFGQSVYSSDPVVDILARVMPWTIFVLSWTTFISFFLGVTMGALMAYWEGGKLDVGLTSYAVLLSSVPYYVLALLLLSFVGYSLGWFPVAGRQPTGVEPGLTLAYILGIIRHAVLPITSMLVASGVASLGMRGNSIRVLGEDYLRVARLRGLSDITISTQYVARNAVLPMYTTFLISIGEMFGGSVVLEQVFTYNGLGLTMLGALQDRDLPLMMGCFVLITVAIVIALLFADLTYAFIDPRASGGEPQ